MADLTNSRHFPKGVPNNPESARSLMNVLGRLDEVTTELIDRLSKSALVEKARTGTISSAESCQYLQMMYHFVRSSSETLIYSGAAASQQRTRDHLWRHAVEELGHEQLIAHDFGALGGDASWLATSHPLPLVQGYISHFRALGFLTAPEERLGAVYVIEHVGKILGPAVTRGLLGAGFEARALTFATTHSGVDDAHADDIRALIESGGCDADAILKGAGFAARVYLGMHEAAVAPEHTFTRPLARFQAAQDHAELVTRLRATCDRVSQSIRETSPFIRSLLAGALKGHPEIYAGYLRSSQWLEHSPTTLCLLAVSPGVRWPDLRSYLWSHSKEKKYRDLIPQDLADLGFAEILSGPRGFWTELFLSYLYDASERAPLQRLGFMLLLEAIQASVPAALPDIIGAELGLTEDRGLRYLREVLRHHAAHGPELWGMLEPMKLTAEEQDEANYGIVAGGYLFARMGEGDETRLW
jgi:pyrroloquinoline quinone (PQQ) biosynthesis protein C